MIVKENITRCINDLMKNTNFQSMSLKEIVSFVLQWGENDAIEHAERHYKYLQKHNEQEKEEETKKRIDYKEEYDETGRLWYSRTHFNSQREESRKLHPGDIIHYKATNPGNQSTEDGIMIVASFDYESDFATRCFADLFVYNQQIELTTDTDEQNVHFIHGAAPSMYSFSLATEEEIEYFFKEMKENKFSDYIFWFTTSKITPDYIIEKYGKYID